jgi:hypothetical protein
MATKKKSGTIVRDKKNERDEREFSDDDEKEMIDLARALFEKLATKAQTMDPELVYRAMFIATAQFAMGFDSTVEEFAEDAVEAFTDAEDDGGDETEDDDDD